MYRPLYTYASEIRKLWPNMSYAARPYVDAMFRLNNVDEMYGAETGKSIVLYFLSNASTWRGEDARRIKAELKKMAGVK